MSRALIVDFVRIGWVSVEGSNHVTAYGWKEGARKKPKMMHR